MNYDQGSTKDTGDLYGERYSDSMATVSVGTTPVKIANQDSDACVLVISTDGTAAVTLGWDLSVTAGKGLVLATTDNYIQFNKWHDGTLPRRAWYAVVAAGTVQVTVTRVRRDLR